MCPKISTDWICASCVIIDRIRTLIGVEEYDDVRPHGMGRESLFSGCFLIATILSTYECTPGAIIIKSISLATARCGCRLPWRGKCL